MAANGRHRNISVTGNDFLFHPAVIAASAPLTGGTGTSCTAAHADNCGTNFMADQVSGEAPFGSQIVANAMMSSHRSPVARMGPGLPGQSAEEPERAHQPAGSAAVTERRR